jgi:hypothetical protein
VTGELPEVIGPAYTTRAFAMVHIAMYDAFVGFTGDGETYYSYSSLPTVSEGML